MGTKTAKNCSAFRQLRIGQITNEKNRRNSNARNNLPGRIDCGRYGGSIFAGIIKMSNTETVGVVVTDENQSGSSYIEWGPVFAGAVLASAISLVLFAFGGGVGLSISSPWANTGASTEPLSYLTMGWVIVAMIFSFIAGGYIAGRLRRPEANATPDAVDFRDGAHGLIVWAVGMLLGAVITAQFSLSAVNLGVTVVAGTAEISDANRLMRGEEVAPNEQRTILAAILQDVKDDGGLTDGDRSYAVELIENNTSLTEAEARSRLEAWETESKESADKMRAVGAITAFLMAASALVAGAAAYFAAGIGGNHRDSNSPFPWTRARAHR